MIGADDFKGASRLMQLDLFSNQITSVALGAFKHLTALQVNSSGFKPTMSDGSTFYDFVGIRTCPAPPPAAHPERAMMWHSDGIGTKHFVFMYACCTRRAAWLVLQ